MTDKRYSMTPIRSYTARPHLPTENMPNNQRSLTPIPLLQDADFLRNARRYPPMAPRPPPPSPVDSRASPPFPGSPNAPRPTTPSGSTCAVPEAPVQELTLLVRSPPPTLQTDAPNAMHAIMGMVTSHSKEIVEYAELKASWIEEQIQMLRDETDAQIKKLEDEFQRKTRKSQ